MLRALETRGYIQRITSSEDTRKNILAVTDTGSVAYETLAQDLYQVMQKLHGDIPQEELVQFQKTLRKLWRNIE